MVNHFYKIAIILAGLSLFSCSQTSKNSALMYYGERTLDQNNDTLFYTIPEFKFIDQDSQLVNTSTVKGKVFVTDFFFTTCPTICPRMKDQLIRVYDEFKTTNNFKIISHTIDPRHDTIPLLKDFAYDKLGLEKGIWHFVTGEKDSIYEMARKYMVTAGEDGTEPGGYIHSGKFILVDRDGHIRGYYDGTDPLSVTDMMRDIKTLLANEK